MLYLDVYLALSIEVSLKR